MKNTIKSEKLSCLIQVKRWWQNRRQKDKNRLRDSLQSLNHFLPSMMYTCEPSRNYNHPYSGEYVMDDS